MLEFLCVTKSHVNPWIEVDLEDVYHVKMIAVTNTEYVGLFYRLIGSELLVGNSTDHATNPSCGVVVDDGGFFECDLWGRYVTLRRANTVNDHYHVAQISVWGERNICPKGTVTQSSVFTDGNGAHSPENAQTPVPILTDDSRGHKVSMTIHESNPYWQLDLGISVPVKELLILGNIKGSQTATQGPGYSVRVGDDTDPHVNPPCNTTPFDITNGREQPCNLMGRYVSVVKGDTNKLALAGVSAFMDCSSPAVPWDEITLPPSMSLGETYTTELSIATTFESFLGVGICG